ncbi:MAG: class I tRNA ligase family protein, partial [Clostridia bacterium]|nr:class I tRNA ligase family protein [Clostridia bacterium]
REWIFARQHYWGEPMPMYYDKNGEVLLVPENELPLTLPQIDDYHPKGGLSPLANAPEWMNFEKDGNQFVREINTMPGSAGSSWYFLRYIDPHNDKEIADKKLLDHWLPVDLYVGGAEHAVGHLLYSRMWNRFLSEQGLYNHPEPFKKLVHQGLLLAQDGRKMSKRWGNVINPDEVIDKYGADVIRLFVMFMGPIQDTKPWNNDNIAGVSRFVEKIWSIYTESDKIKDKQNKKLEKIYHQTVKKVTQDYEELSYNTAISQMMIFMNAVAKEDVFPTEYAKCFIKMLNPLAPYITEEIWQTVFGNSNTISYEPWPTYDEAKLAEEKVEMVVQINGKVRDKMVVPTDSDEEFVKNTAQNLKTIKTLLNGKEIKKIIIVKNKIVNIVAI